MSDSVDTIYFGPGSNPGVRIGNPVSQIIELATGGSPSAAQLAGWQAYEQSGGSLASIAHAFSASAAFANVYNGGVAVNPDASITSSLAEGLIGRAVGSHTSAQVQAWVATGSSVADVFQSFALNDHFVGEVGVAVAQAVVVNLGGGATLVGPVANYVATGSLAGSAPQPIIAVSQGFTAAFHNAPTEMFAGGTGSSSHSDVTSALTIAQALDMTAVSAAHSQPGGLIPADTGVLDWFQYGGDTYIVEAINSSATAEAHTELVPTDGLVEIMGLIDLTNAQFSGYTLSF